MEAISLSTYAFRAAAVLLLVAANAFFVAAEFGLVAARRTRITSLAKRGDKKAKLAEAAIQSLDRYISATQLGITLASLGLGWIGEPAVASLIETAFAHIPPPMDFLATHAVATVIAFSLITVLHIVLGELAPKALALLHPEATSRWVVAPLMVFTVATNPFIWLLNGAANIVLKILGVRSPTGHERVHQPEEILMLVEQSGRSGQINTGDVNLIRGVFAFSEKVAKDVMTPRTEVKGIEADLTVEEAAERVAQIGRSRYPIYDDSLDNIIAVTHAKQILGNLKEGRFNKVRDIVSGEPLFVPGTREVQHLLSDMKNLKQHIAIVLDEYGGTAGIVTMEDLLEEIVGHIYDEYDEPTADGIASPDGMVVRGNAAIEDLNEEFDFGIETDQHQTVGGYVFGTLGRLPRIGDRVPIAHGMLEVTEMVGKRISRLKVVQRQPKPQGKNLTGRKGEETGKTDV
jgi:CBS domain containing-hemolysin-like protein